MGKKWGSIAAGAGAGAINGLLGAGGGTVLVPGLQGLTDIAQKDLFPTSVAVITPVCLVSLAVYGFREGLPLAESLPYLLGSGLGGLGAGLFGRRIPTKLLHKALGLLMLWGGVRAFW